MMRVQHGVMFRVASLAFFIFEKRPNEIWLFLAFFGELDFLCQFGRFQHFESRDTIYSYFEIGLKPAVVSCLTNTLAPPPIALESCSRAQTDRTVF